MSSSNKQPWPPVHPASQQALNPGSYYYTTTSTTRYDHRALYASPPVSVDYPSAPYQRSVPLPSITPRVAYSQLPAPEPRRSKSSQASPAVVPSLQDERAATTYPTPLPIVVATSAAPSPVFPSKADPLSARTSVKSPSVEDKLPLRSSSAKPKSCMKPVSNHSYDTQGKPRDSTTRDAPTASAGPSAQRPASDWYNRTFFELCPDLPAPVAPDVANLRWDMSLPHTDAKLCNRFARRSLQVDKAFLSSPATIPPLSWLELVLQPREDVPDEWKRIRVTASASFSKGGVVTTGDVLQAIYDALHGYVTRREYPSLSRRCQERVSKASELKQRRINAGAVPVTLRIDCLYSTWFGGLERPLKGQGDVWHVVFRGQ